MKRILFGCILALCSVATYAQCNGVVTDEAGVIKNPTAIEQGASALINQGADVHVVTVSSVRQFGSHLQDVENFYERKCSNWLSADGTRKSNLLVFMVAPTDRMKNVFYGSTYSAAFPSKDSIDSLYSKYANPYFAHKQWDDGFVAALGGFNSAVAAFHDEQKHPVANTTNVQATDLSPIASFFKWVLLILALAAVIGLLIFLVRRRKQDAEARSAAQRDAVQAQGRAAGLFLAMDKSNPGYGAIAAEYERLSNSVTYDPSSAGQSADTYNAIQRGWTALATSIEDATNPNPRTKVQAQAPASRPKHKRATASGHTAPEPPVERSYRRTIEEETYVPAPIFTPTVVPVPVIIEEEPERHYRQPEPSSSRSDDDDTDKKSGSDSTWSAPDLGSSGNDSMFNDGGGSGGSGSDSGF